MCPRILVIDDDLDAGLLARLTLEIHGHTVMIACDGFEGLSMASSSPPDLVILDVMMPDMDGIEVCQRLRAQHSTATVPVIMLSGKGQVVDKVSGLRAGADEYVTKPIDPAELAARVESLLLRSAARCSHTTRAKILALVGAKGGVGTSTVGVNLSAALLKQGDRVVLVDLHQQFGCLPAMVGLAPASSLAQLATVAAEDIIVADVERHLLYHGSGLQVLTAAISGANSDCGLLDKPHVKAIINQLSFMADWVVVDLPAEPTRASEATLERCNLVALVTEPDPLSLRCAAARLDWLQNYGIYGQLVGAVVVNRSPAAMLLPIEDVERTLGVAVAAVVPPAAEACFKALREQRPLIAVEPDHYASSVFREMASRLRDARAFPKSH